MDIGRIIQSLSVKQLIRLSFFAIRRPLLFYCFVKATKQCIFIATKNFGKTHHKNNQANAYRHALWNMLIAFHSTQKGKSISVALTWTKTMTDWHEMAFENNPLEKAMDLHNNEMGRNWFQELYEEKKSLSVADIDSRLMKEIKSSKKVTVLNDIKSTSKTLVYIT